VKFSEIIRLNCNYVAQVCSVAHGLGYIVIPACNLCLHFLIAEIIRLNIL
jgi:hypothetical protein